jgi:hypothetical protein
VTFLAASLPCAWAPRKRYSRRKLTIMKAIELAGDGGFDSLRLVDTEQPNPTTSQILIQVKAAKAGQSRRSGREREEWTMQRCYTFGQEIQHRFHLPMRLLYCP